GGAVGPHVGLVLPQRDRRHADVVTAFEKERSPDTPRIANAIAVRCPADHAPADDRDLLLDLEKLQRALDDLKVQAQSSGQLGSAQLAGEMQRFEGELKNQIERNPRVLDALRRGGKRNDVPAV